MATKYWLGTADGVAQIDTVQVTAFDSATQYVITIGEDSVSVPGNTDVNTTASDLQAALAASTNPYFLAVTWTVSTDTITATATDPGNPFVASSSVTGGTGTIGSVTSVTASSGPCHFDDARNWSGGTLPAANDTLIFENGSVNVCFGLEPTNEYDQIEVRQSYTGRIGLDPKAFTQSADGDTTTATKEEYRPTYLKTGFDTLIIGQSFGIANTAGSSRVRIDNDQAAASVLTVFDTANSSDGNLPAIQYKAANSNADIFVREAPGGIGVAVGLPGETSTIGDVNVNTPSAATKVQIGGGTTLTNFTQNGGTNVLSAAATVTSINVNGGTLTTEGNFVTTTMTINSGTVNANSAPGGTSITTLQMNGGTVDMTGSAATRTIGTLSQDGGTLVLDDAYVTVSTWEEPAGEHSVAVS